MGRDQLRKIVTNAGIFCLIVVSTIVLIRCAGSSAPVAGMGSANVTMSDPPSCANYSHVWVTVDGVSASTSGSANSGWESLVSNLSSASGNIQAVQLDLMNLPTGASSPQIQCLLASLGSTSSLPAGDYQQIRLQLVPNNTPAGDVTLLNGQSNSCDSGWNCVELQNQTNTNELKLSSQAVTGLKIPPGQIVGGPIHVSPGQSVDINIDFNACRSIVNAGGQYRLDPTLVAFQTSKNLSGISGQVVQGTVSGGNVTYSNTSAPVPGANVALELDPNNNPTDGTTAVDLITNWSKVADSTGKFDFCPLPSTYTFDVVADAGASGTTTGNYNASILTEVPASGIPEGTYVTIPLVAETGGTGTGAPGTLTGDVSATTSSGNSSVQVNAYALQTAASSQEFADPLLPSLTTPFPLSLSCSAGNCSSTSFTLIVPPSDPAVGTYTGTGTPSWAAPSSTSTGDYKVEATCVDANGAIAAYTFSDSVSVTSGSSTGVTPDPLTLTSCP